MNNSSDEMDLPLENDIETVTADSESADTELLSESINDAIQQIRDIPEFRVSNVSSEGLKNSLIPILESANKRVSDIEYINKGLDAVRGEIIEPVNRIIGDSSKPSIAIGKWGLWFGGFGILISVFTIYIGQISPWLNKPESDRQLNEISTEETFSSNKIDELKQLLQGREFTYSSKLYEKVVDLTGKIESMLQEVNAPDLVKIQTYEAEIDSLLTEVDKNDGSLIQQVIYCTALLNSEKQEWEKILDLAEYIDRHDLPKSGYYYSFLIYKAESYFRLGNVDAALGLYHELVSSGDKHNYVSVLEPDNREKRSVKKIALSRLKRITVDREIDVSKVILLNSSANKIPGLAAEEKKKLLKMGFESKNVITGTDKKKVSKIYGYYRNQKTQWLLDEIITAIYPGNQKDRIDVTKFDETSSDMVKNAFLDESVGVLIRMPNPM